MSRRSLTTTFAMASGLWWTLATATANGQQQAPATGSSEAVPSSPVPPPPTESLTESPAPATNPPAVVPPRLIHNAQPEYPVAAQRQGIGASVTLELDIDETGSVVRSVVVTPAETTGYGFDEAALNVAPKLRFDPATLEGRPVTVRLHYQLHFVPDLKPAASETPTAEQATEAPAALPSGDLTGTLVERGTRKPLAGVTVTVFRGSGESAEGFETESDSEGQFRFEGLATGTWRVLAEPEGYYPVRETEVVTNRQVVDVRFLIERSSYNPYDVVVDAKRVKREVTRHTISTAQADRIPGTFGDVLAVVKNFPGVARTPVVGTQGLVVRGSAPEDTKQFIDGMHIPQVYHFGGLRSVLSVGMTESIEFTPGNFSAQYGRATGGIIGVGLAPLDSDAASGYADVSVFDTGLFLEVPVSENLSIALGGRRSYVDVVLAPLLGGGGGTVAPRYYDAQALVRYQPAAAHQLSAFFLISDDAFRFVTDEPVITDAETTVGEFGIFNRFSRGLMEYRYVPNAKVENRFQLSYGQDYSNIAVGDLQVKARVATGQLRDTFRYRWSDNVELTTGADYLFESVDGEGSLPTLPREGDAEEDPDFSEGTPVDILSTFHSTAGFMEMSLAPFAGTLVVPSLRVEHFSRAGKTKISPRLTLRQTLSDSFALKGGVGHFVQEPEFLDTDAAVGNPDLDLKQAIHYSAGFEYRPLPHVLLDVTAFYKTLTNQVSRTDAVIERDGQLVPANLDSRGRGRVSGLEVSFKHELSSNLFAWVAYTLSKAERRDSGGETYRLFDYDQTHILTAMASYRLPRNWEVSTRFRYVTGNAYTPFKYGVFDSDADTYSGVPGPANSARSSAFHQLDIRIDKRWVYDTWMLGAYMDLQNVYNRPNEDGVEFNYDYTTSQGDTGLPIIPVLGLRGEF